MVGSPSRLPTFGVLYGVRGKKEALRSRKGNNETKGIVMENKLYFSPEIMEWYRETLRCFGSERVEKSPTDTDVLCPVHGDRNPSLGADLRENGRGPKVVLNCRSQGCEYQEILDAVGLTTTDLYYHEEPNGKPSSAGCTIAQYARAKGLPEDFLKSDAVALEDTEWWGVEAVEIPYADEEGDYVLSRYRISLAGDRKVVSKKGDTVMPYGLNRLDDAQEAEYILLVEGESDCHSAWHRGIPAIGTPGANTWKPEWSHYLDGIPRILVIVEPDGGGRELWEKVVAVDSLFRRLEKVVLS